MRTICNPGEPLLSPTPPLLAAQRAQDATRVFGPHTPLISSLYVATPIPRHPLPDTIPATALTHPLCWLPPAVADRRTLDDDTLETDDRWAARVAAETNLAGLYAEDTGEWTDMLAAAGLDPAADHDRLVAWMAGGPDEALDELEEATTSLWDGDDPTLAGDLVDANWDAMTAQVWAATLGEMAELAPTLPPHTLGVAVEAWLLGLAGCPQAEGVGDVWRAAAARGDAGWLAGQAASMAAGLG